MRYDVVITSVDQEAIFDLRCLDKSDFEVFFSRLGAPGPIEQHCVVKINDYEVLKLGPRRAWLKSVLQNEQPIEKLLTNALADASRLSIVNVSDLYLGLRICGPDALEVLAHVVPLNLYELSPGRGAMTAVFSLSGMVICERDNQYVILVDRSYLDYVRQRLTYCALAEETVG